MEILGRNAPCPCGSGRKFKRCHGVEVLNASSKQREEFVPSVYRPFPPHGVYPWVVEAMKRVSRR